MKHKTITINGKTFKIIEGDIDKAYWGEISFKTRTIKIFPGLRPFKRAEIVLHEGLHAAFPTTSEQKISRVARDLARFLRIMQLLK